jgi:maleate cis-trans isomerase
MSLLDKLNLKPTAKKVAVGASLTIERELNAFMHKAIKDAFKASDKYKKYLKEDLKESNVFVQQANDKMELRTIKGDVILIPCEDVELTNGTDKAKLDTAFKVGVFQTYIKGITNQYIEYIEKKK